MSQQKKIRKLRIFIIILPIILLGTNTFGQIFTGFSTNKNDGYQCNITIHNDSIINFAYSRDDNGIYAEHIGTIKKIDDTLFHVSTIMTIGQFYMKSNSDDTLYIHIDSLISLQLDKIQIEYLDKTHEQLQGYDKYRKPIDCLKIPLGKNKFNRKAGSNYVIITINRKSFITGDFLSFKIPFGSAASFTSDYKVNFNVIIKNGELYTTDKPPSQTGHFKLKIK